MTEPLNRDNYSPISTLDRQYASPIGERLLIFVKASANCSVDVETILRHSKRQQQQQQQQTTTQNSSPSHNNNNIAYGSNAGPVSYTAHPGDASIAAAVADDPFAFLDSGGNGGGGGAKDLIPMNNNNNNNNHGSRQQQQNGRSSGGGGSLKHKFMNKVKQTQKHIERGMTTMVIKAGSKKSKDSFQCVLQDGLGQLWSMTDSCVSLAQSHHGMEDESSNGELSFGIPLTLWPWLDREGSITISLFVKSGATLLKQQKPYKVGSVHLNVMELITALKQNNQTNKSNTNNMAAAGACLTKPLESILVQNGTVHLLVLPDNKFPIVHQVGSSLTDPDLPGYVEQMYHWPLDQSYAYPSKRTHTHTHTTQLSSTLSQPPTYTWPIATERTIESSVVLPLATAYAQLVQRASHISLQHASSVCTDIAEHRHDVKETSKKANVQLGVHHLVVNDPSRPIKATLATHWLRPDCIFEVELSQETRLPVYTADMTVGGQPTLGVEFYPKVFDTTAAASSILPAIVSGYSNAHQPLPPFMIGHLTLRIRVSSPSSSKNVPTVTAASNAVDPFAPLPANRTAQTAMHSHDNHHNEEIWHATIALETMMNAPLAVTGGAKSPPLKVPVYHAATGASMGFLILNLAVQMPPSLPSATASSATPLLTSSRGGLVSLVGLDTLMEDTGMSPSLDYDPIGIATMAITDPNKLRRRSQFRTMGNFVSSTYLQQHITNVRAPHIHAADHKATEYYAALVDHNFSPQGGNSPPLCSHQEKSPRAFRPSSSRTDPLLSGIGFNIHIQSLAVSIHECDTTHTNTSNKGSAVFNNITCGAPADHAMGFGNALSSMPQSSSSAPSSNTHNPNATTPVGIISGGLRRLEAKRLNLAKALVDAQSLLIQTMGQYFATAKQQGIHHIPARHAKIAPLRWNVFELTQMLHSVTWLCAVRRSNVFSQALGIAISSYLTAISSQCCHTSSAKTTGWPHVWVQHGFLVSFEGLLSAVGKELGMIEDASVGISMLRMVHVVLVSADDKLDSIRSSKTTNVNTIPVIHSPHVKHVRLEACIEEGSATKYRLEIGMDPIYYSQHIPDPLQHGNSVQLYPVLYQVGVDIRQWGAHAGQNVKNNVKNQRSNTHNNNSTSTSTTSSSFDGQEAGLGDGGEQDAIGDSSNGGLLDEDDEDEIGIPDDDELISLNYEAFRKMNHYANLISPSVAGDQQQQLFESFPGADSSSPVTAATAHENVHPLLRNLYSQIMSSAGKMAHGILDEAATVAERLGGGGVVFCKSGKDRTAMHVTYKAAQFANRYLTQMEGRLPPHNEASSSQPTTVEEDGSSSSSSGTNHAGTTIFSDATRMRVYGTRLPICEKNVGQAKFAFNALQVKFMPEMLKPPMNTLAGFLKGGAVFRGGGIES